MGATGAAAGAEVWGGGHGASGACVAARYVRLVCVAKRRGLEAEPFVVRRLGVLPLLAALSARSCELDLLPDLLATLGEGEPTGEVSDAAEL